eukprot:11374174-Ditylum_brightwellii.AAC.1
MIRFQQHHGGDGIFTTTFLEKKESDTCALIAHMMIYVEVFGKATNFLQSKMAVQMTPPIYDMTVHHRISNGFMFLVENTSAGEGGKDGSPTSSALGIMKFIRRTTLG